MSAGLKKQPLRGDRKAAPSRRRTLVWLILPTAVLLPLVSLSTFWRVDTHVQLDSSTTRLAFSLGGKERHELLNRAVQFNELVVEKCRSLSFTADPLELADPQVPGAAWREIPHTDPVQFACTDPAAKLTLRNPDPASTVSAGILDRLHFAPGSQVILEVVPGRETALSLETAMPEEIHLNFGPAFELRTDLVRPVGFKVPFAGDLLTWRARLPETQRTLTVTSGEHGLVLIVTPTATDAAQIFRDDLDLPLTGVDLLEESLEGTVKSALSDETTTLRYPDFSGLIPPVTLKKGQPLGLSGLSLARLNRLVFDAKKGALSVGFDGIAAHAASKAGAFTSDHRLTLFQVLRYNWRSGLLATAFLWLVATTTAIFEVLKTLRE